MKEEYLDIVDENNNLINLKKLRSEVHKKGLWHRTVHIYIFNEQKQFLVHLRSKDKDNNPNQWDTRFGGHVKVGENLKKTAIEELQEEISLKISGDELLEGQVFKRDEDSNKEFCNAYYYEYNDSLSNLNFNDGEVQKIRWMNINDIIQSISDNEDEWSAGIKNLKKINNYLHKILKK